MILIVRQLAYPITLLCLSYNFFQIYHNFINNFSSRHQGGGADTLKFNLHIIRRTKKRCEFNQKRCELKILLFLILNIFKSHYTIMSRFVFEFYPKYVNFKYFQKVEIILFLIKNIGYNYFKVFFDIFYSLYFKFSRYVYQYWN
jgi:hypothetical protein